MLRGNQVGSPLLRLSDIKTVELVFGLNFV